jgi:hypothetical protein
VKYMLMMHAPRAGWKNAGIGTWPVEDIKTHIRFMKDFAGELHRAGELVGGEGLASPEDARIVRAGASGAPEVTDGPFAEAKEVLGGYWMIEVASRAEAIGWAKKCPAAVNEVIEIRQVQEMTDFPPDVQAAAAGFGGLKN